jgi:hypothetical protein
MRWLSNTERGHRLARRSYPPPIPQALRVGPRAVGCQSADRPLVMFSGETELLAPHTLYARMFTARAATRRTVIAESVDSAAINALAGRVSGIASVGLNAVAFVSDT